MLTLILPFRRPPTPRAHPRPVAPDLPPYTPPRPPLALVRRLADPIIPNRYPLHPTRGDAR